MKEKALEQANDAKLEGNKLFGDGQFEEALSQYELALQVAPEMPSLVELRSICHANRAVCFMKLVCFSFQCYTEQKLFNCLCIFLRLCSLIFIGMKLQKPQIRIRYFMQ